MARNLKLSKAVANLRTKLELSQGKFGEKLGVSAMAISRWEAATNQPPADCTVAMAKMAPNFEQFWFFLGQIGLTKKDIARRS
ncbi:MAG TPA: helix-turn-helix transcriptional regulator [Terriglobales bacterium]|nr:helix-turn-helix transcriptional regulator [Terriglobales bacterium]